MHDLFVIIPLIITLGGSKPHGRCCFRKIEESLPQKRLGELSSIESVREDRIVFDLLSLAYPNLLYLSMSLERSP